MADVDAQLALFGAIDDKVCHTTNPTVLGLVEEFLPGSTRPGQRGWYRELQGYVKRNATALRPDPDRAEAAGEVRFPTLAQALDRITAEPAGAPVTAKLLYAANVLKHVVDEEDPDAFGPEAAPFFERDAPMDPVAALVNQASPADPDTCIGMAGRLTGAKDRNSYRQTILDLEGDDGIPAPVARGPDACAGRLRRVGGQYCSVVRTDWLRPDITLEQMAATIEPRNWPMLYDFFVDIRTRTPLTTAGWIRVLEVVSPDRSQWVLRTSLRYWKAEPRAGGICINYELDDVRDPADSGLVEVDNGYLWITELEPGVPQSGVRIRTSKELRMRGLSPTSTAALACHSGWSDAGTQMLTDNAHNPPSGCIPFQPFSPTQEPDTDTQAGPADTPPTDPVAAAEAAAEALDLPTGWREVLIDSVRGNAQHYVDVAAGLANQTARQWADGLSDADLRDLGTRWGQAWTDYAVQVFNSALASLRTDSEEQH